MAISDIMDDDIASMIADWAHTLTYSGTSYSCVIGAVNDGVVVEVDGLLDDGGLQVVLQVSLFASLAAMPKVGDKVTVNSKTYKVNATADFPLPSPVWRTLTVVEAGR